MKLMISFLIMILSIMMYFLNQPLSMGLMILIQTILICLIAGMMINTYWFSYILFLTFMGGLLVLFIYVSSIASNEIFLNKKLFIYFILLLLNGMILSYLFLNKLKWLNFNFNYEMNNKFYMFYFFNNENKINLNKLYNNQTFTMMMILIIYLFITLVAVVKITNIFYGPLRSNFN
nr:NADH dehydrogenase subunit 6 [Stomphastis thraustica]